MSVSQASPSSSVRELVLWPAIVTLGVTMLRLYGELSGWSPRFFSREAGGAAALIGIVWLIPVFGVYFGARLAREGARPAHLGRALGFALVAFAFNTAMGIAAFNVIKSPVGQLAAFTVTSWLALLIARPGWPALWRVLMAYALAARIPVLVVMAVSIFGGLDTHYAKPRPDFPPMGPAGLFFWTALLPQLSIWIYLTVVGGAIFGTIAAAVAGRRSPVSLERAEQA
jgi:hypothetical protein